MTEERKDRTEDGEDRRTETARRHDDKDMIENSEPAPDQQGRAGGNLQRDVGTSKPEQRVEDADAGGKVTKSKELQYGDGSGRPGERSRS